MIEVAIQSGTNCIASHSQLLPKPVQIVQRLLHNEGNNNLTKPAKFADLLRVSLDAAYAELDISNDCCTPVKRTRRWTNLLESYKPNYKNS